MYCINLCTVHMYSTSTRVGALLHAPRACGLPRKLRCVRALLMQWRAGGWAFPWLRARGDRHHAHSSLRSLHKAACSPASSRLFLSFLSATLPDFIYSASRLCFSPLLCLCLFLSLLLLCAALVSPSSLPRLRLSLVPRDFNTRILKSRLSF